MRPPNERSRPRRKGGSSMISMAAGTEDQGTSGPTPPAVTNLRQYRLDTEEQVAKEAAVEALFTALVAVSAYLEGTVTVSYVLGRLGYAGNCADRAQFRGWDWLDDREVS